MVLFQHGFGFNSPAFTGTPTAPTPPPGDNSNKIATTAFISAPGIDFLPTLGQVGGGTAPTGYAYRQCRYLQIGKLVLATYNFQITGKGTLAGAQPLAITLPVPAIAPAACAVAPISGHAFILDAGFYYVIAVLLAGNSVTSLTLFQQGTTLANFPPDHIAATQDFFFNLMYEAA
jgi:hypothetical protein